LISKLNLNKRLSPVCNIRKITKHDLVWNNALPHIEVDPETYTVKANGRELRCEPAAVLPLAQRYFLF
jgi:urease subunit alpha